MRILKIDRKKWLRGEGEPLSFLLREHDGKMCCLGFDAIACGFKPEQIRGYKTLPSALGSAHELPSHYVNPNGGNHLINSVFSDLYAYNDSSRLSEGEREKHLTQLFAKLDIEVQFHD